MDVAARHPDGVCPADIRVRVVADHQRLPGRNARALERRAEEGGRRLAAAEVRGEKDRVEGVRAETLDKLLLESAAVDDLLERIAFAGDVPLGAGMSSSAALESTYAYVAVLARILKYWISR